jgi:hypothetical protein
MQRINVNEEVWDWKQVDLSDKPQTIVHIEPSMPWITFFMRKERRQTSQGIFVGYHVYDKKVDLELKKQYEESLR